MFELTSAISVVNSGFRKSHYTVSQKTGPLRLTWHNFTNSQHLLIIFGGERPYSILSSQR